MVKSLNLFLVISLCIIACSSYSQTGYFTIDNILVGKDSPYNFPLVRKTENPLAADKINRAIQIVMVGKSYKVVGNNLFSDAVDELGHGMTSLSYEILQNSKAILSIKFTDETIAAYPDYHTAYFNFNSGTGDLIVLSDLLNLSGIQHLNQMANSKFNDKIEQYYNELQDEEIETDEKKELIEYVFDLTECNANSDIWKCGFTEKSVVIEKDRCFPHVIQARDINWSLEIMIKELFSSDFTGYGKNIIKNQIQDISKSNKLEVDNIFILHGRIGDKYPFTIYFRTYLDNSLSGYYWYDKFGKLIEIKGSIGDNNKITLVEKDGIFNLNLNSKQGFIGVWTDKNERSFDISFY
jgi:hypothetical protein